MTALPPQELLLELARTRMPFGKYKGELLLRLPEAYLAWFARQGMPKGKLGVLLESARVIRSNGLDALVRPLLDDTSALPSTELEESSEE